MIYYLSVVYAVGTQIDLRHLNEKPAKQDSPDQTKFGSFEYVPGTRILFLNFKSGLQILKTQTRTA
jgi:hypothetical protein